MDARIVQVMESWPLQLALQTPAGGEHIALSEDARIRRRGVIVDPGELSPGQHVRVLARNSRGEVGELEILE